MYQQFFYSFLHLLFSYGFYRSYGYIIKHNHFNVNYFKKGTIKGSLLTPEYRTVNIVKSITLGVLSVPTLYYYFYPENYQSFVYQISIAGAIYSATDLSAIIFNPKAHNSTQIHHVLVQVLYYYSMLNSWNAYTLSYLIYIYATFSIFSYLVNGRLAIRNMNFDTWKEDVINDVSFTIYGLCCIVNWYLQFYYLMTINFVEPLYVQGIYCCLVALIIYDDVFLMKYLHKNAKYINYDNLNYITKNNHLLLY